MLERESTVGSMVWLDILIDDTHSVIQITLWVRYNFINPKAHRLIAYMINAFTDLVLKEVDFSGGCAGASSRYSTSSYSPDLAFQQNAKDTNIRWISGHGKTGSGNYVRFPHLIWYSFGKPFVPGRISFGPSPNDGHKNQYWFGATKWQFIGTNDKVCDEKSAWTILCEDLSGKHFEWMMQNKYCVVENKWVKYKCLGISALESSYPDYPQVHMSGIRMWERVLWLTS